MRPLRHRTSSVVSILLTKAFCAGVFLRLSHYFLFRFVTSGNISARTIFAAPRELFRVSASLALDDEVSGLSDFQPLAVISHAKMLRLTLNSMPIITFYGTVPLPGFLCLFLDDSVRNGIRTHTADRCSILANIMWAALFYILPPWDGCSSQTAQLLSIGVASLVPGFIDFSLSSDHTRRHEVIDYPKVVLIIIEPSPFKKKQVF